LKTVEENLSLDKNQVSKAIKCIKDLVAKKHKDSLNILSNEDEELIYLNFVLSKLPLKYSLRPVTVPLAKSINGVIFNTRVCLFVKDSKADFKQLAIDFPFKVKVIDVQQLKMKFSRFQDRRNLLKQFDLFMCDYKIYFLLKKLLGKPFYVQRKYPVPIKLNYEDKEDIKNEVVNHVEKSGVFYMNNGPNYAFKVARYNMDNADIVENTLSSVKYVIGHIMKWGVEFQE
jgi:ribosome biogenesis protein UTP30